MISISSSLVGEEARNGWGWDMHYVPKGQQGALVLTGCNANTFPLVEGQHHQWHLLDFITCYISEKS